MAFRLPKLPYAYKALEPHIDAKTMEIHHAKHHAGYVANLNSALKGQKRLQKISVEELLWKIKSVPANIRQTVINNAGGHANHSFFWPIMTPRKTNSEGNILKAIKDTFGSVDTFKEKFTDNAMSVFGSGWGFLIYTKTGKLRLKKHSFQNSPLMQGNVPLLGIDVWEHAYYLKYQNRRADYIKAWWNAVNWPQVEKNFQKVLS